MLTPACESGPVNLGGHLLWHPFEHSFGYGEYRAPALAPAHGCHAHPEVVLAPVVHDDAPVGMGVEVDEAGGDDEAPRVYRLPVSLKLRPRYLNYLSVLDPDVGPEPRVTRSICDHTVLDDNI